MCIAFPGKIVSINEDNIAVIDISGTRREVCLDIVDEDVMVGDYVISHAGYAIHKVDEQMARENLELLRQIMENEIY
jgi:hydrogenase expression/formation protein HypC